ncbi:PRD domain-containing protein [Clostridium tertium]
MQYLDEVKCTRIIKNYVKNVINKQISEDEILYLSMHIIRVSSD